MTTPQTDATREAWLDYLARHRRETAYVLFAVSAAALIPAYLSYHHVPEYLPVCGGSILLASVALVGALWQLGREPDDAAEPDATRVVVVSIGGAIGLVIFLAALWQTWQWGDVLTGGIEKWQGPERWKIWSCVGAVLGGLAISFASLLLARKNERTNATLRRLLYGFNAGVSGMLLLAILVFANLMLYVLQERGTVEASYDCTATGMYTLSAHSKRLLENLEQPVTVYAIWPVQSPTFNEVATLLNNCRNVTNKLSVEVISPEDRRVYELKAKYQFTDRVGFLVVYGPEGGSAYDFIPVSDLYTVDRRPQPDGGRGTQPQKLVFKGEGALMSRLAFLTEDKPPSQRVLDALKKPATVYALFTGNEPNVNRIRGLIDQSKAANKDLHVEYLSPKKDPQKVEALRKQYKVGDSSGLLLVYAGDANPKQEYFTPGQIFQKWVIYFTQGEGEPDLNDTNEDVLDRGLANLKRRLEEGTYEVRGLQFSPVPDSKASTAQLEVANRVPDNAAAVVVVRPTRSIPPYGLAALKEYMQPTVKGKKKGKLIVLLDVVAGTDRTHMQETGIEGILAEYGVVAGKAQVLLLRKNRPETVPVIHNPESRNPIGTVFAQLGEGLGVLFTKVRELDVAPPHPGSNYSPDVVAIVPGNVVWLLTDLGVRPEDMPEAEMWNRRANKHIPFLIAVSEHSATAPGAPPGPSEPRLVVFGDATFVTNRFVRQGEGDLNYDLFASSLGWLRDRPADIGIAPKDREYFALKPGTSPGRLVWLPAILMFVGIVGLGAGVWVVRRR